MRERVSENIAIECKNLKLNFAYFRAEFSNYKLLSV